MNKKRILQQYEFLEKRYLYSEKNYMNVYIRKDDLYVFLNDYDNMNVYSMYPEMVIFKMPNNNSTNIFKQKEDNLDNFGKRIHMMKNIYNKIKYKFDEFEGKDKKNIRDYVKLKKKYREFLINKYFSYQIIDHIRDKLNDMKITNAWLKCYEIIHKFDLLNDKTIKSFHICELPGAFILATMHYVKKTGKQLDWVGQSLNPYNETVRETMRGKYLEDMYKMATKYENNYDFGYYDISKGDNGTGDITDIKNIKYYHEKYGKSRDFVTSDCGQDSKDNFVGQEEKLNKVIWGQFVCAIGLLKKGGNYFAKIFSIQTVRMIEYIYLCTILFEQVYIVKPLKTKMLSGERYVVCKNFLDNNTNKYLNLFYSNFDKSSLLKNINIIDDNFIDKLHKCNTILGQRRITNINKLIFLINNINFYAEHTIAKKHIDNIMKYYIEYYTEYHQLQ